MKKIDLPGRCAGFIQPRRDGRYQCWVTASFGHSEPEMMTPVKVYATEQRAAAFIAQWEREHSSSIHGVEGGGANQ